MEPPGPGVPPGPEAPGIAVLAARASPAWVARAAVGVGAAALTVFALGDAFLLGVLLGAAATRVVTGAAGVLVAFAVLERWGSASLAAVAGGQAVLGAAGWVGPDAAAASAWLGAVALVMAAPRQLAGAVPCGLAAGLVVAGPAWADDPLVRLAGAVAGAAAAVTCGRVLPRRLSSVVAIASGGAAWLVATRI